MNGIKETFGYPSIDGQSLSSVNDIRIFSGGKSKFIMLKINSLRVDMN